MASNRKSGPVLIFGFGAILAMIVGMVMVGLAHLESMQLSRQTLADIREKTFAVHEMHEAVQRRSFSLARAQTLEDFFDRDAEQQRFNAYARDFVVALERIEVLGVGPEERSILDEIYSAVNANRPQLETAIAAVVDGEAERSELDRLIARAVESHSQVIHALDRFAGVEEKLERDRFRGAGEHAARARLLMMLIGGLIGLASLAIALFVIRRERWHTDALMAEIGDRDRAENAVRDLNRSLEQRVAERTRELTEQMAERKKMAEKLLESELRHRATIATAPNAIITIDGDGLIESFNPAAERIFGYSMGEAIGENISFLMPQPYRDDHDAHMSSFRRTGESRIIGIGRDLLGRRKDGAVFPIRLSINDMEAGGRHRFVGIVEDITQRKEVEQDLRAAKEQAEIANEAKSNFLASMSHELRTPMNAILGFTQMLALNPKEKLSAKQEEYVGDILRSGEHLMALISQVLELSRIDTGNLELSLARVDPKAAIDDSLHMIEARAASRQIAIVREYAADTPAGIVTDGLRFKQVLLNLLSNAVKYNKDRGSITVGCKPTPDGRVRITVADTGEGFSPDRLDELFQPFNRLGKEAGQVEGAGIGLTIAKDLVELLGGRIGCNSEPGVGSTFWFELPANAGVKSGSDFGTQAADQPEQRETTQRRAEGVGA